MREYTRRPKKSTLDVIFLDVRWSENIRGQFEHLAKLPKDAPAKQSVNECEHYDTKRWTKDDLNKSNKS